jgi:hypothetical protein
MATRYRITGWIETVLEVRYAADVEEFLAFCVAATGDPLIGPYLNQISASGGPPVGAMFDLQSEQSAFFRLSCPAHVAAFVLGRIQELLERHIPPTPPG